MAVDAYHIVQNSGREIFWQNGNFRNLVGKTCNELSLSSSIKTHHSYAMLNLKTTIIYFIITCSAKMVHTFVVSSVVRGYHKYKDVWSAPIARVELSCERELYRNPKDTLDVAMIKQILISIAADCGCYTMHSYSLPYFVFLC